MSDTTLNNDTSGWQPFLPPDRHGLIPWKSGKVWFWGLLALLVAVLATIAWGIPTIEAKLDRQSRARLLNANVDASTLNLRWNYRDLSVNGELPANVDVDQLTDILRRETDGRSLFFAKGIRRLSIDVKPSSQSSIRLLNDDSQLAVNVKIESNSAMLEGMVQTQLQRQVLVNALLESGVESISDNLDVLSDNAAANGGDTKIDVLADMLVISGPDEVVVLDADLDERTLNYRVTAKTRQAALEIENSAAVTMIDFLVSGDTTFPRAGAVDVVASSDGSLLTLSGQVVSEEQRRRLSFSANEAMGGADKVKNKLTINKQQAGMVGTDDRVNELASVISRFIPGVSGEVEMRGSQLSLNAVVDSEIARASLKEVTASASDNGLELRENITVARVDGHDEITALQHKLNELAGEVGQNVFFLSGNATLDNKAKATLDRVVEVLNNYPHLQIEVEGHTDNIGRDAINESISKKRATAVKRYLVSKSVVDSRLVAVGYGHRRPLVPNDSPEGRRHNRRVHFNVIKNQLTN